MLIRDKIYNMTESQSHNPEEQAEQPYRLWYDEVLLKAAETDEALASAIDHCVQAEGFVEKRGTDFDHVLFLEAKRALRKRVFGSEDPIDLRPKDS